MLRTGIVANMWLYKCFECRNKYLEDRKVYGGYNASIRVKVSFSEQNTN